MLAERIKVTLVIVPLVVLFVYLGGLPYALGVIFVLSVASWEFWRIYRQGGHSPSLVLMVGGSALLATARFFFDETANNVVLSALVLTAAIVHMIAHERGRDNSATDFAITIAGALYLGWLGAYLVSLRNLPDGQWWFLTAMPAAWLADGGAYMVGMHYGRHKMAPRISPKKTWEGYAGGIVTAVLCCTLLAACWNLVVPAITPLKGAILGLVISILAPMGDFAESMFKRQFGVKDASKLLPGHGGFFDRIDTSLWAAVIGYYLILWLR
jgi:phosphatidate cytidylyltransferase